MKQLSRIRIPNFEEMIVNSSDDSVVVPVPGHHGHFGFEETFIRC